MGSRSRETVDCLHFTASEMAWARQERARLLSLVCARKVPTLVSNYHHLAIKAGLRYVQWRALRADYCEIEDNKRITLGGLEDAVAAAINDTPQGVFTRSEVRIKYAQGSSARSRSYPNPPVTLYKFKSIIGQSPAV